MVLGAFVNTITRVKRESCVNQERARRCKRLNLCTMSLETGRRICYTPQVRRPAKPTDSIPRILDTMTSQG